MTALDIFCLIICSLFLLQGIWYGFLKGLFFLIAWVAAVLGAYFSYDLLGDFLTGIFEWSDLTIRFICLAIGFLVPFLLFSILGRFIHKAVSSTALNLPNRLLGAFLGLFKSILICTFILTIVHFLPLTSSWDTARQNSNSYKLYLQELALFGIDNTPPDIKGIVKEKTNTAIEKAEEKIKETAENAITESIQKATNSNTEKETPKKQAESK